MTNADRAVRQLERFFDALNSSADLQRIARNAPLPPSLLKGAKLIVTIVYDPEKKTIRYEPAT